MNLLSTTGDRVWDIKYCLNPQSNILLIIQYTLPVENKGFLRCLANLWSIGTKMEIIKAITSVSISYDTNWNNLKASINKLIDFK